MIRVGMTLLASATAATLLIGSKATPYLKFTGSLFIAGFTVAVLPKKQLSSEEKAAKKRLQAQKAELEAAARLENARLDAAMRWGYDPYPLTNK